MMMTNILILTPRSPFPEPTLLLVVLLCAPLETAPRCILMPHISGTQVNFHKYKPGHSVSWVVDAARNLVLRLGISRVDLLYQRIILKLKMGAKAKTFLALLLLLSAAFYYFCQEGDFSSLQTKHKFRIYKDEQGIPRIYARDKQSALYGLGFAEAQGRLWSLHLRKMVVQGRLSEIFGAEALAFDLENRNFDFKGVGEMNAKLLGDQERAQMQAFCDGINDYARTTRILPFEFYLTFTQWEDWLISDTMSMLALMSFVLEFDWMYQLARQRLLETVGFDLAWKVMPFGDDNLFREVTIMTKDEIKEQGRYKEYDSRVIERILKEHWVNKTMNIGSVHMPQTDYDSMGSNAWVIGGKHTANGKPLLANDPHLGLLIPSLFSVAEVNLVDENDEVVWSAFGAKADGFPAISIGINNKFAWGSTASYVDNKDVYHEVVRDNNGTLEYLFKQKWHPFSIRREVFNIRGQGQLVKQYYHTHRGPVVEHLFDEVHMKYGYPIPQHYRINHTITLASAIYVPDKDSFKGLLNLAFSRTFEEFETASSLINAPNIDSVFITDNGTFGFSGVGRIPHRKIPEMGGFVKDGSTDLYDMGDFLSWEEMPKLRNPERGYISMANNKFAEDSFDTRSSIHEVSTGRSYRIDNLIRQGIANNTKFTHQHMQQMQLDTRDEFLSEAFPLLLGALDKVRHIWENSKTRQYYQLLSKWDYHMPATSVEAAIYHVFEHHFHETLLHNTNLAPQEREAILNHAFFELYFMRLYERIGRSNLTEEERTVCANADTDNYTDIHPCLANAALTFQKLPVLLEKLFGSEEVSSYQWGSIHRHTFKSVPWSDVPGLKHIWSRSCPAGGNSRTLNVGILTHQTKSYNSIGGPVFRFVTDIDQTYWSLDTGNSDRVTSQFYDNFLGKDLYVKYTRQNPIKDSSVQWATLVDRIH